jgi:hypothetical protein
MMSFRNLNRVGLSITTVAIATVLLTTNAPADFTVYSDDFSGSGGVLDGTTPDIAFNTDPFADLTWYAGETTFFDDGSIDSDDSNPNNPERGGGAAYLPFEPEVGRTYTLSADVNNLTLGWVGFGFVQNPFNAFIDDDSGRHEQGAFGSQWIQVFPDEARMKDSKISGSPADPVPTLATVDGLTGTNSLEIVLDTNDPDNVQVSFSVNDALAHTYNAGPLATIGYEGGSGAGPIEHGIRGVGFSASGCCGAPLTVLDGIDNLLLVSSGDIPPVLGLEVNTTSGVMTLQGNGSAAENINSYQITSALGQLDPSGWNSLDDQDFPAGLAGDFDGNGAVAGADFLKWQTDGLTPEELASWESNYGNTGGGAATGWEEGGAVDASFLGEAMLVGDSTIATDASISLGTGYAGPADGDLKFVYRAASGSLVKGNVSYVGAVAAATVPEPSSVVLVAAMLLGLSTRRKQTGTVSLLTANP